MKKIVSLLLVLMLLVSSVAVLSACGEKGNPALENAKNVVFSMYKDKVSTPVDYELVSQVKTVDGTFTVTWEADNATNVKMNAPENNKVKVEITASREADVNYNLTATIADAKGNTMTVTFACTIPQDKSLGNDKPVVGTAYKYYLNQVNLGKILFFNGKMDGEYLGTTDDPSVSPDVFSEEVDGGYRFYFMNGTTKTYIQIYKNSNDKIRPQLVTEPTMVFTYDETVKVFFATVGETQYYLGTYNSYNTFSASAASYITGSNASKIGVSQFPGMFTKTANLDIVEKTDAQKVEKEKADLSISGNATATDDYSITLPAIGSTYADVTVTWEVVGETAAAAISGNKLNITLQKAATSVTVKATITCGEETATKEFTIEVPKVPAIVPVVATTPVVGTAYKLYLKQANLGKNLYFTGVMNGFYYGTTETYGTTPDVYVEEADGGYYITFTLSAKKFYLAIQYALGTDNNYHTNVVFVEAVADASVFAFNTEYNTFTTDVVEGSETNTYYLGTYGTYNTISASKLSKISTSFPVQLVTMLDKDAVADADKVASEKADLNAPATSITEAGATTLPVLGVVYDDVVISWAVSGSTVASIVDGKLVISELPAEDATLTLTATLTVGEVTDTKEFTVTLKAKALTQAEIVDMAYALAKDASLPEKYTLTGVIVRIDTAYDSGYKNITVTIVVSSANKPIECYRMTAVNKDDADQVAQVAALKVGDVISVNGTLTNYNGKIEFTAGCTLEAVDADAALTDEQKAALAKETLAAPATSITATGNTALVGSLHGATIEWAVAANDYATITTDGLVVSTLPTAPTNITLTATITAGDVVLSKEFSILVSAPVQEQLAASLSFANKSNRTTYTTAQQVWAQNGIVLTNDKASSTSNVGDYYNPARFYKSSKITVAYTGMTKIVFHCDSASYASALKSSITDTSVTVSVSGSDVTIILASAADSYVIASLGGGQVRVKSVDVYIAG